MTSLSSGDLARSRAADEPGIRFGIGQAVLVGAVLLAGAVRLDAHATLALLVVALVAAGAGLGPAWTLALALSAWAYFTGFLEHTGGTLAFADHDRDHLVLLVGVGLLVGLAPRRLGR